MIEGIAMADKCKGPMAARPEALPPARGVVAVQNLLGWAIGHQKAHLAAGTASVVELEWLHGGTRSMTGVVGDVAVLGVQIDRPPGWAPRSFPVDDDAALVFDQVQACLRSWSIYRLVMVYAETDRAPDWRPGARCRAEACDVAADGRARQSSHTVEYAVPVWTAHVRNRRTKRLEVIEKLGGLWPGNGWHIGRWVHERIQGVPYTPIAWHDTPEEIVAARAEYAAWHKALGEIAGALNVDAGRSTGLQRWHKVTHPLPAHPWPIEDDARLGRMALEIELARREAVQHGETAPRRPATAGRFDTSGIRKAVDRGGEC